MCHAGCCLVLVFSFMAIAGVCHPSRTNDFIRRDGRRLVLGGSEIQLRGVCFGNKVWQNVEIPVDHHSYLDYQRVKAMGMNVVRFYMNYRTFEDDTKPYVYRESGFGWIDKNLQWARENGIFLILNIHVPQGGFQSLGRGGALWEDADNQKRLIALWKALARRYRDETVIAGYDILNEPYPTRTVEQWKDLANRIVRSIRAADPNHLIIVEKAMGVASDPASFNRPDNFFLVPDTNTAYTFHFYDPGDFTFQGLTFLGLTNEARYPDESRAVPPADMQWSWAAFENPVLGTGTTGWRTYTGILYPATNSNWTFAFPVLQSSRNSGAALFRSFEVHEYDPRRKFIRTVLRTGITDRQRWTLWSADKSGWMSFGTESGRAHVKIAGTSDDAAAIDTALGFEIRTGNYYQINGEMSGSIVPGGARSQFRIDFYRSPGGNKIQKWNRAYLENEMERFVTFGRDNAVPLYVGEFGVDFLAYEADRGGLRWVKDVLSLFEQYGLSYTYHAYHEGLFGIYRNDECLPAEKDVNRPLVDLFTRELKK